MPFDFAALEASTRIKIPMRSVDVGIPGVTVDLLQAVDSDDVIVTARFIAYSQVRLPGESYNDVPAITAAVQRAVGRLMSEVKLAGAAE